MKNWEATQKHSGNLTQSLEMLSEIRQYVEALRCSEDLENGICSWTDASESGRLVHDLKDLYHRITGQGEYRCES